MSMTQSSSLGKQVLAATQTPGEAGMKWFQGTADAVRQFLWVFEVCMELCNHLKKNPDRNRWTLHLIFFSFLPTGNGV